MSLEQYIEFFKSTLKQPDGVDDVDWESTMRTIAEHALEHGLIVGEQASQDQSTVKSEDLKGQ